MSSNTSDQMNEIVEGLWLGSLEAAEDERALKDEGITHLVSCGVFPVTVGKGVSHLRLEKLSDKSTTEITHHFPKVVEFIKTALAEDGKVLVHCKAGMSRSASQVIAYLMTEKEMSFVEALTHCKKKRPAVCPNDGFADQLRQYEKDLKAQKNNGGTTNLEQLKET